MRAPEAMPAKGAHYWYRAYGLTIASAVQLPELTAIDGETRRPDMTITLGTLPEIGPDEAPPGARQIGPFLWATPQRFWFCVPRIARFRITAGNDIVVDADPVGDMDGVRTFLLGTAFGVLLAQRGHLMLHGNAVRVGAGCVVCVGPSGAGKSTLAAGFMRRGFALFSDDLIMVDEQGRVTPGVPRIKLWGDMTRAMAIDSAPLRRIRPNLEKFSYPAQRDFADAAMPTRAIYSLVSTTTDAVSIDRLHGFAKFKEVRANIYRPQFVDAMGMRERDLALCTQLTAKVPVARIARPVLGFTLDRLIDAILEDLGEPR